LTLASNIEVKENKKMNNKISPLKICVLALAVCINLIGGQVALVLRLPIYLDSIGTILVGALYGPLYGLIPNLLSGVIFGMTTDIYSLYFAPVGMIVGFMSGMVWKKKTAGLWWPVVASFFITVPGTLVSAVICAKLFGGITSSGSTVLVQLLAKTPLGMTGSVFAVQIITDYVDRLISLVLVIRIIRILPAHMKNQMERRKIHGYTGGEIQ
jgi:energy-coupling factor transport system substrate-specific component